MKRKCNVVSLMFNILMHEVVSHSHSAESFCRAVERWQAAAEDAHADELRQRGGSGL